MGLLPSEGESRVYSGTEIWFQLTSGQSVFRSQVMVVKGRALYLGNGRPGTRGTEAPKVTFLEGRGRRAGVQRPGGLSCASWHDRPDSPAPWAGVPEAGCPYRLASQASTPQGQRSAQITWVSSAVDHGLGPTSREQGAGRSPPPAHQHPRAGPAQEMPTLQPGTKCHSRSSRCQ